MKSLTTRPPEWTATAPIKAEATRELAASASEVFAALCDHESWPKWFSSLSKVEAFGDPAEGVGSKRRVHIGKKVQIEEEFIVWDTDTAWGFTVTGSSIGGLRSMNELVTIKALADDRCQVTYLMAIDPAPALKPLIRMATRSIQKNLNKALLELDGYIADQR